MKRRRFIILLALLALAVGLVVFALVRPAAREPVYLGRALREWLVEFDHRYDTTNYSAAQKAIRAMGTNSLPFLISYLRSEDPLFQRQWVILKARLGLLRKNPDYAKNWHRRAAIACGELGLDRAAGFQAMLKAISDPNAVGEVIDALSRMLPSSAPVLTNLLATGNVLARCQAAGALATAYSHPEIEEMARTALLRALRDPDPGPRMNAALAFQFWTQRLDVVVPALARALSDPELHVRGHAASSLGNFGSAAKPAVPELLKLLSDTNVYPSNSAMKALLKIDPEAAAKAAGN